MTMSFLPDLPDPDCRCPTVEGLAVAAFTGTQREAAPVHNYGSEPEPSLEDLVAEHFEADPPPMLLNADAQTIAGRLGIDATPDSQPPPPTRPKEESDV